jgi:hypothetical protein
MFDELERPNQKSVVAGREPELEPTEEDEPAEEPTAEEVPEEE